MSAFPSPQDWISDKSLGPTDQANFLETLKQYEQGVRFEKLPDRLKEKGLASLAAQYLGERWERTKGIGKA